MPEHFERVHREYRDGAEFETEHEFNVRTGALVDELVAAVREVGAAADRVRSRLTAGIPCGGAVDWLLHEIACVSVSLAALDEEAGRGH